MEPISEADLIINSDGTIYHLNLTPEETPLTVILVGDPDRVSTVSRYFDEVNVTKKSREFVIHIGSLKGLDIMVMSTGMGTDNIDIVLNELDALWNIDFKTRMIHSEIRSANIVRIGTSGSIQSNIPAGTIGYSEQAVGFDALWSWYDVPHEQVHPKLNPVSVFKAGQSLLARFKPHMTPLTTGTMPGFYGPQGRLLRLNSTVNMESIVEARVGDKPIDNLEMETAGIYGLAALLGHEAISINAILANRIEGTFTDQSEKIVDQAIRTTLDILTNEN